MFICSDFWTYVNVWVNVQSNVKIAAAVTLIWRLSPTAPIHPTWVFHSPGGHRAAKSNRLHSQPWWTHISTCKYAKGQLFHNVFHFDISVFISTHCLLLTTSVEVGGAFTGSWYLYFCVDHLSQHSNSRETGSSIVLIHWCPFLVARLFVTQSCFSCPYSSCPSSTSPGQTKWWIKVWRPWWRQ